MVKKILLQADFEQQNVRPGVLEMLANNLKDDSDKEVSKSSIKESIAHIQKGNKVPYGPANHLLICILRSLSLVEDFDDDEPFQGSSHANDAVNESVEEVEDVSDSDPSLDRDIENDESLSQMLKEARKKAEKTKGSAGTSMSTSKSDNSDGQKRQEKREKYPKHGKKELPPKTSAKGTKFAGST